jgi:hypothetical protein
MGKELCDCGKMAVWFYMPGYEGKKDEQPYYCEECVPRGCSCNHYSTRGDDYSPPGEDGIYPTESDQPVKWLDDHTWTSVDEQGREYPCCEYDYDEKGFDK